MIALLCFFLTLFASPFKSKSRLEAENAALRHQVFVLQRRLRGRVQLTNGIVCSWSCCIDGSHRSSGPSRSSDRRPWCAGIGPAFAVTGVGNPSWGAPRIHGELLKLGINISQATVGRWMPWRPKVPSPTWRSFLRNHLPEIVAIDMFVVATATFRLLYALIVLSLDRRRVVHFEVTSNPAQYWLAGQVAGAIGAGNPAPWEAGKLPPWGPARDSRV